MGSFMQQPEANEAGNGMPPNWRAATKAAKGVQDTIKEMMRKEQVRKEREEREEIVTDLERILDKALRLGVEVSPTALSRVGIEMKHLPLAWEHMIIDPQSLNTDFFFKPMPVEIIREHAPILVPVDDSDHVPDIVDSQGPAQNSGTPRNLTRSDKARAQTTMGTWTRTMRVGFGTIEALTTSALS